MAEPINNLQNGTNNPTKKAINDELLQEQEEKVNKELAGESTGDESSDSTPNEQTPETPSQDSPTGDETPTEEQPTKETTGSEETEESQDDDVTKDPELSQLSERGQKRIADLANKAKKSTELEEEVDRLRTQLDRDIPTPEWLKPKQDAKPNKLPWDTTDDGNGVKEVSQEEYEADVQRKATEAAREEIRREKLVERLNGDIATVEGRYSELRKPTDDNPNPQFNQKLVDFITNTYQSLVKQDHNLRLLDFVENVMALRKQGAEEGRKQVRKVINKMAAEQALDPSGTPPVSNDNSAIETKIKGARSIKDLEALEKQLPVAE